MIGRTLRETFPPRTQRPDVEVPLLEVRGLNWDDRLRDISLVVHKGEILGLSGLEGQGQGDLLFALFGVYAGVHGYLDRIAVSNVTRYEQGLLSELESNGGDVLTSIRKEGQLSDATEGKLKSLLDSYTQAFA